MVVIVASLALGKSTLKVSRLHTFMVLTRLRRDGAYLTRFPGFRTHVKRESFPSSGEALSVLCIPIFLG